MLQDYFKLLVKIRFFQMENQDRVYCDDLIRLFSVEIKGRTSKHDGIAK